VGVSLLLALAEYLKSAPWLAHDVILVFLDGRVDSDLHSVKASSAWMETYARGHPQQPFLRAGSIRAALNLDLSLCSSDALVLRVVGLNGQTPSSDVPNVVAVRAQHTQGSPIPLRIYHLNHEKPGVLGGLIADAPYQEGHSASPYHSVGAGKAMRAQESWESIFDFYWSHYASFYHSMYDMVLGVPQGDHSPFLRDNIDALTIANHRAMQGERNEYLISTASITTVVASSIRSLNNLLEELHHPPFLYVPTAPSRFWEFGSQLPFALPSSIGWGAIVGQVWTNYGETPRFVLQPTLQALAVLLLHCMALFALPMVLMASGAFTSEVITRMVAASAVLSVTSLLLWQLRSCTNKHMEKGDSAVWRSLRSHAVIWASLGALTTTAASFGLGSVLTLLMLCASWFSRPWRAVQATWGRLGGSLYGFCGLFVMSASSPWALLLGLAWGEGLGVLPTLEMIMDEFIVSQNALWPALCFLHLPVHILFVHLLFGSGYRA